MSTRTKEQMRVTSPSTAAPVRSRIPARPAPRQSGHSELPPVAQEAINSPGRALDPETQAAMEPALGHEFSRVRIHTDERAAESAEIFGARAYTAGRDIAFAQGQYSPETAAGRELLAHELMHVRQQSARSEAVLQKADLEDLLPPATEKPEKAIPAARQKKAAGAVSKAFTFPAGHTSDRFTGQNKRLVEKGRAMVAPGSELAKKMAAGTQVTYKVPAKGGKEKAVTEKKAVTVSGKVNEVPVLVMWELYERLRNVKGKSGDATTRFLVDVIDEFWLSSGSTAKLGTTWVRDFPEMTEWLKSRGFDAITSNNLIPGPLVFIDQHGLIEPGPYRDKPEEEKAKRTVDLVTAHEIIHALGYTDLWIHEFLKKFGLCP